MTIEIQRAEDPNAAIDWMAAKFQAKNDAALADILDVRPPVISKIRHKKLPIGAMMLIKVHELTGMHIRDIRSELGMS